MQMNSSGRIFTPERDDLGEAENVVLGSHSCISKELIINHKQKTNH